ncbi:hypothetical protein ACJMK2_035026 [Sinanodonta woodiana]|uniref:GPI inositol-deacylase n=1 Tax=Sinanodonta woodiana TaxID=1069815 RepID=A0ABD3WTI1_SINWO
MAGSGAYIFSVAVVAIIVIGILDVLTNFESNSCEMTYMFEQPEYIRVPMKKNVSKSFPRFELYIYGEGPYAKSIAKLKLEGIPVLFIPGHGGSFKQVRSLGSVALRKTEMLAQKNHFNYFSVDLNEDLSGMFGGVLWQETEYVHHAIQKILSLYKNAQNPPKSVVLVGHSMGGMIARALFVLPDFDSQTVHTIITEATPHQGPVMALDGNLKHFYHTVNEHWLKYKNSSLSHVTVVSTGGGHRDVMVRQGLTSLNDIVDSSRSVSTCTMSVPRAWVSTDHQCAVWCRQMVLATERSLFNIVDKDTKQISTDPEFRMSVFKHHFLTNPTSTNFFAKWRQDVKLDPAKKWTLKKEKSWKLTQDSITEETYFAIPLEGEYVDEVVIVSNSPQVDWVCACKLNDNEERCSTCKNLSPKGQLLPPLHSNKKVIHLNLKDEGLQNMSHVVVIFPPTPHGVIIIAEVYDSMGRHLVNSIPGLFEIMVSFPESVLKGMLILDLNEGSSYYRLKLMNLNNVVKAYAATLVVSKCKDEKPVETEGSVLHFNIPWVNEDTYKYMKYGENGSLSLKLQSGPVDDNKDSIVINMYLDPTCVYQLKILASLKEMFGQFVRFYGTLIPAYCVAVLLMSLTYQLKSLAGAGECPSALQSILWAWKPLRLAPIAMVLQFLARNEDVQHFLILLHVPTFDGAFLIRQGIWFRGAHMVFYLTGFGIIAFHAVIVNAVIQIASRILGLIFGWCPVSRFGHILCLIMTVVAAVLSLLFCGAIGIFVSYIICLIQVLKLCYQSSRNNDARLKSKFHFFFLLFLTWMWVLILNSPSLIIWVKNVQYSHSLAEDPSRITGFLGSILLFIFLLCDTPFSGRSAFKMVGYAVHALSTLLLVYGVESIFRVPYFALVSLAAVALPIVAQELTAKFSRRPKTE